VTYCYSAAKWESFDTSDDRQLRRTYVNADWSATASSPVGLDRSAWSWPRYDYWQSRISMINLNVNASTATVYVA